MGNKMDIRLYIQSQEGYLVEYLQISRLERVLVVVVGRLGIFVTKCTFLFSGMHDVNILRKLLLAVHVSV